MEQAIMDVEILVNNPAAQPVFSCGYYELLVLAPLSTRIDLFLKSNTIFSSVPFFGKGILDAL